MEGKKVAVVTGGNRGLGLAVVRALAEAEAEKMVVVMGARDLVAGGRACEELKLSNVVVQQLDVQDPASIARFAAWLQSQFGGLDILVNNAAISGWRLDKEVFEKYNINVEQVMLDEDTRRKVLINDYDLGKTCIDINYYGAKRMIEALLPLFKASSTGAHIINVSSRIGQLRVNNAAVFGWRLDKEAFEKYNIQMEQIFLDEDTRRKVVINDYDLGKTCIDINYYGAKRMIEALLPLFKASSTGSHIINVSSRIGQ